MSGSAGMDLLQKKTYVHSATTNFNATSETLSTPFANPIEVYRWGYISETAVVVDATAQVTLEAEVAGGGTNRVSGSQLNLVDADDHIQGVTVFTDAVIPVAETVLNTVGIGGQKKNVDPSGPFHVFPGERVSFNITDAATSGTIRFWMEYVERPVIGQPGTTVATLLTSGVNDATRYLKR